MDNELLTAALIGALGGSIITVLVMHLVDMRIMRNITREASTLNGIDLFAEHHGMHRNPGESDQDLIDRVNREGVSYE